MSYMMLKQTVQVALSCLVGCGLLTLVAIPSQAQSHDDKGNKPTTFEPLTIEKQHLIQFDASPQRMFELMSPEDGNHWTGKTPEYLFGSNERLSGAMWKSGDGWYIIAEYNPEKLVMRTVLWIKDEEYMVEEVRCETNGQSGTIMTLLWRVAGISEESNAGVRGFFDQYWDRRMNNVEKTYNRLLEKYGNQ